MIAKFTFGYGTKLDDTQLSSMKELVGKDIKVEDDGQLISYEQYEAELELVLQILDGKSSISVIGIGDPRPLVEIRDQLLDALGKVEDRVVRHLPTEQYLNPRVEVHVSDLGLLMMNEVELLEDGCTSALQGKLDDGWRILAVCPQPDQRRPDYVLCKGGS